MVFRRRRAFVRSLELGPDAQASLEQALAAGEIDTLATAKLLEADEWKELGLKLGTRTKVVKLLVDYEPPANSGSGGGGRRRARGGRRGGRSGAGA